MKAICRERPTAKLAKYKRGREALLSAAGPGGAETALSGSGAPSAAASAARSPGRIAEFGKQEHFSGMIPFVSRAALPVGCSNTRLYSLSSSTRLWWGKAQESWNRVTESVRLGKMLKIKSSS